MDHPLGVKSRRNAAGSCRWRCAAKKFAADEWLLQVVQEQAVEQPRQHLLAFTPKNGRCVFEFGAAKATDLLTFRAAGSGG
jgi:hypothetical protein